MAFDLEEYQPSCSLRVNCSCQGITCGSNNFVQNLTRYLNSTGIKFQGAFVLETILNHNTTPNSQELPSTLQQALPTLYQKIKADQFKGDFLTVVGRLHDDKKLIDAIINAFHNCCKYGLLPFGHFSSIKTRTLFLDCLLAGIKLSTETTNKKNNNNNNKN